MCKETKRVFRMQKKNKTNIFNKLGNKTTVVGMFLFVALMFGHFSIQNRNMAKLYKDSRTQKESYNRSAKNIAIVGMIPLLIVAYMLAIAFRNGKKTEKIMNELEVIGKDYNLDKTDLLKLLDSPLMETGLNVISHISSKNPKFFEMLANDELSTESKKLHFRLAVSIVQGYLKNRPAEEEKVLDMFSGHFTEFLNKTADYEDAEFAKDAFDPDKRFLKNTNTISLYDYVNRFHIPSPIEQQFLNNMRNRQFED